MTKKFQILEDGRLSPLAKNVSAVIGLAAVAGLYLIDDLDDIRTWILAVVAVVFGLGSAWAGLMQKWGYKPFSNDPSGWRKAKSSYEEDSQPRAGSKPD